ncbi:MAG TPA: phage portal protein, partial [Phycisphaerae bacterium]|nr:phage portal protein [Phycisphaerae bacterium]
MTETVTVRRAMDAAGGLVAAGSRADLSARLATAEKALTLSEAARRFLSGQDVDLAGSGMGGPADPFRQSLWVHLCISRIVTAAARVPLRLSVADAPAGTRELGGLRGVRTWVAHTARSRCIGRARRESAAARAAATNAQGRPSLGFKGVGEIVESGDLHELLSRPNERQNWTSFIEQTIGLLYCHGRVLWIADEMVGRRVKSMIVFPGDKAKPVVDKTGLAGQLVGWKLTLPGGGTDTVGLDEVIAFSLFNPESPDAGLAPHEPGRLAIVSDYNASLYNAAMFGNSAEPGGVLSTDAPFDAAADEQIRTTWNQRHRGPAKAKVPAVLWGGLSWQTVATSLADMQFDQGKRLVREEICAVYGVPPSVAGFLGTTGDSSAYVTGEQARYWYDTVGPLLGKLAEAINEHLSPRFIGNLTAWFDLDDVPVIGELRRSRVDGARKLWDMGTPLADCSEIYDLGVPQRPWHDQGFLAAGLLPAADVAEGNVMPAIPEGLPEFGPFGPPDDDGEPPPPIPASPAPGLGEDAAGDPSSKPGHLEAVDRIDKAALDRVWRAFARSWNGLARQAGSALKVRLAVQQRRLIAAIRRELRSAADIPRSRTGGLGPKPGVLDAGAKDDGVVGRLLLEIFGEPKDKAAWRARVAR